MYISINLILYFLSRSMLDLFAAVRFSQYGTNSGE